MVSNGTPFARVTVVADEWYAAEPMLFRQYPVIQHAVAFGQVQLQ